MVRMPVIQLAGPLISVRIESSLKTDAAPTDRADHGASAGGIPEAHAAALQDLEEQQQTLGQLCRSLQSIGAKLNQLYENLFAGHNEAIARLAVEIARKVLMQKIENGEYAIESIIRETLKNAPDNTGLVLRLNPHDLANVRHLQEAGDLSLPGVTLAEDAGIGRAECMVESAKGIVKLMIDEHLEQISQALTKTG